MVRCDNTLHTGVDLQQISSFHDHNYVEYAGYERPVRVLLLVEVDLGAMVVEQQLHSHGPEDELRSIVRIHMFSIEDRKYSRTEPHNDTYFC